MKIPSTIAKLLSLPFIPIRKNGTFFAFMYLLGFVCACAVLVKQKRTESYTFAAQELFLDVYLLTVLLTVLPSMLRKWVRRAIYVVAYALTLIDVFCFVKYDSTLTPTMLLLLGETNSREAGEFLQTCFSLDVLFSSVGLILLILLAHIAFTLYCRRRKKTTRQQADLNHCKYALPLAGMLTLGLFIWCLTKCFDNKVAFVRLMSYDKIGNVEHELTRQDRARLCQPIYRLAFSIYANRLTSKQLGRLIEGIDKVYVDSCSYRSENIVLIIGESYNKSHAQLYGYDKPTTPRQVARAKKGELVPYSDVIAPWNLTSFVFKLLFSLYTVGDKGEWCDYPLFPELFRKVGYHVSFITNQFLPQAKEAVYDFSGGFFLNNPQLSKAMFDTRNTQLYYFDEGLLTNYDQLKGEMGLHNLTIFHLKGQHVDYRTRCPKSKMRWMTTDYDRPKLNKRERKILSYYDNSLLYNDSIVDQIIQRYENENAIVIYVPDHGEQVFDDDVHFFCRMHSAEITPRLARLEYEIPFWIYCSPKYRAANPAIYAEVVRCKDRRFMTDALPHLLLYLGGIHSPDYRETLNVLSDYYDEARPRLLKGVTDYDKLKAESHEE